MNNSDKLKKMISALPDAPGVYLMKDTVGKVIYIGKAKSLKKRVSNYLGQDLASKTVVLMSHVVDLEYKLTQTESLALVLEASLVHQYQPRYNVSLRDDKSFPLVKITHEKFPAVCITRKKDADGARYFGPYTNVKLLKEALKIIRKHFPYRSCKQLPRKACIYYRLGLSPAPCIAKIGRKEYARTIAKIVLILEGKTEALIKKLSREMLLKSKAKEFEAAAQSRDQLNALSALIPAQPGVYFHNQTQDLQNALKLHKLPLRIEAFDISNISGKEATGSMVSFFGGWPDKNNYRRFRIKTVEGIDDYRMLAEIVSRRYLRLTQEGLALPDLILIDGGRAHLSVAKAEVEKLGLAIPIVSIAKEEENVYTLDNQEPLKLKSDAPALNLMRRVRDEAHRFALSYHHLLRRKKLLKT